MVNLNEAFINDGSDGALTELRKYFFYFHFKEKTLKIPIFLNLISKTEEIY